MNKYEVPLPQLVLIRLRSHVAGLNKKIWQDPVDLPVEVASDGGECSREEAPTLTYEKIGSDEVFAPHGWNSRWFRIPCESVRPYTACAAGEGEREAYLEWRVNGETLLYHGDIPWCGLDTAHLRCPLPPLSGEDGAEHLYLRCGTYQTGQWMRPGEEALPSCGANGLLFHSARLVFKDSLQWEAYHSMDILLQWVERQMDLWRGASPQIGYQPPLENCPPLLRRLLVDLDECMDSYELGESEEYRRRSARIYEKYPAAQWEHSVAVVGNSHIDLVWLWPEAVTEQKTIHTCATTLRLMERYPDFTFTFSQPEMLERIGRQEPELYRQIRDRIAEGRWEMTGAMDVEGDTLLPSGEGILRNILLGQNRFRRLTGKPSEVLWLPDAFGFPTCLPQLAAQGGVKYFFTTKLSWSAVNRFPHGSFLWHSPDGSSLISHVARIGYEARGNVEEAEKCAWTYSQAGVHHESLLAVGFGDGGGGVTEGHCERIGRMASLASLPQCRWARADEFFRRLEDVAEKLPVHRGELYLEYHRGTYTTMARMKSLYRRAERALQVLEAAAAVTGLAADSDPIWERMAFFQFHDALPGSSIALVYREMLEELESIIRLCRGKAGELLGIVPPGTGDSARTERGRPEELCFWNLQAVKNRFLVCLDAVELDGGGEDYFQLTDEEGDPIPFQKSVDGDLLVSLAIEGLSTRTVRTVPENPSANGKNPGESSVAGVAAERSKLMNGLVTASFNEAGQLIALEVEDTAVALSGPAALALHRDRPADFEAWDVDQSLTWMEIGGKVQTPLKVVEPGPVRGILRGEAPLGENSRIRVDYILEAGSRHLKVAVSVDWREEGRLLRYEVPTAYVDGMPLYGAPFNAVRRPQYSAQPGANGLWEVPASRWMALTDGLDRGLALITKDKYGFSCTQGRVSLSLLRSPRSADEISSAGSGEYFDKGQHLIEFAIGFHKALSDDRGMNTAQAAEGLYAEPVRVGPGGIPAPFSLETLGTMTVSWVKPAENGSGLVLRLHETGGAAGTFRLNFTGGLHEHVWLSDITENPHAALEPEGQGQFSIPYGAHQIMTLLIR